MDIQKIVESFVSAAVKDNSLISKLDVNPLEILQKVTGFDLANIDIAKVVEAIKKALSNIGGIDLGKIGESATKAVADKIGDAVTDKMGDVAGDLLGGILGGAKK